MRKSLSSGLAGALTSFKSSDNSFMVILAIIIGILGGLGAALLRFLIHLFQDTLWGGWGSALGIFKTLLIPTMGAFVVGLIIHFFSKEAKGHGVPEVMEAISMRSGVIRPRVVASKAVASALTIASGGSVGREGPIIQIGSAIGSGLGQLLKVSRKRMHTLVGCGAAAGIAAAFNAPIAGAMFSVEILLEDFSVRQFSPIVISSVSATVISRIFFGNQPAFVVPKYDLVHPLELIPYAILGLVAGLVGLLFMKVLYLFEDKFDAVKKPDYVKTTIGGLLIGLYGLSFPQIFGVGYEAMDQALLGRMDIWILFALIFVKILASSITLGSGNSGGVFAPSLFMGAMTGGFFGHILYKLFPAYTGGPGAYALVAMSAVVAATTHAPITSILIIFEMTSDYKIILPLMIATTISSLLATKLQKGSIYTLKLMRRGINFHQGREINVLQSMTVSDVMRESIETVPPQTPIQSLIQQFINSSHSYLFIRDEAGHIIEKISLAELGTVAPDYEHLKDFVVADDIASPNRLLVNETDNLDYVMREFGKENVDEIPVVSSKDPTRILGTVWRVDLISAYNKEILKRDMSDGLSKIMKSANHLSMAEVGDGLFLMEMDVPVDFVGKSVRDLQVRNRYSVDIVLIKKKTSSGRLTALTKVPDGNYCFEKDDRLLVLGARKKIEKLSLL